MRIGRRPDERHKAVILDLVGDLTEEDWSELLLRLRKEGQAETIVLNLEYLQSISDDSIKLLHGMHRTYRCEHRRIVLVAPKEAVANKIQSHQSSIQGDRLEVFQAGQDVFKPPNTDSPVRS